MPRVDDAPWKAAFADRDAPLTWRKSTWSIANGQCLEAAILADGTLGVRDSTDNAGTIARFAKGEWHTFIKDIKNGDYDAV